MSHPTLHCLPRLKALPEAESDGNRRQCPFMLSQSGVAPSSSSSSPHRTHNHGVKVKRRKKATAVPTAALPDDQNREEGR